MKTYTVGQGKYRGRTNAAIQQAVDDAAAAGGGTVVVPPGTYRMRDALHLRSRVSIVGRPGAILKKVPSVEGRIPAFLGYGHFEIIVEEPEKFPVGTGVHIFDDKAGGFYTTQATVIGRQGKLLFINRMFNHDYNATHNARVVSAFSLVEGCGIEDAAIEGLTLDGSAAQETFMLNGCRGSGLFLLETHRIAIRNVEVRAYRGDAIGFQQSTDILVDHCHVHHNVGQGLHPGSGTVRTIMQDSLLHDNGCCGIFYCLRTSHSICRRNVIRSNGQAGISVGERDTDHLIEDNTIVGNAWEGILFREALYVGGDRTVVKGNRIGPNGAKEPRHEISVERGVVDVHVVGNTFTAAHGRPLAVARGCRQVTFAGNTVDGRPQQPADVAGPGRASLKRPRRLPRVGPSALPSDGARHLGIAKLRPWKEATFVPGGQ